MNEKRNIPLAAISRVEPLLTRQRFLLALGLALPPWSVLAVIVANFATAAGKCTAGRRSTLIGIAVGGMVVAACGFLLARTQLGAVLPGDKALSSPEKRFKFARFMNEILAGFSLLILFAFILVACFLNPCEP